MPQKTGNTSYHKIFMPLLMINPEILYRRTPDGSFVAISDSIVAPGSVGSFATVKTKTDRTESVLRIEPKTSTAQAPMVPLGLAKLSDVMPDGWNGWPDGNFQCFVTFEEYKETGNLKVNWASKGHGGDKTGSTESETYKRGKRSSRQCLGASICDNSDCNIIIRSSH